MHSISKRLISNYLLIGLFMLVILESLFIFAIVQYYMGGIERNLSNHADVAAAFYSQYEPTDIQGDKVTIQDKSKFIFENLNDGEKALVEVVDLSGNIVIDNTGSASLEKVTTADYAKALATGKTEPWIGRSELNESIISVSAPIYHEKEIIGVLRYVSSLERAHKVISQFILLALAIGAAVLALAAVLGFLMSRRIVVPIRELIRVTQEIAEGNFKVKAIKYHNDEIGQLVDAVNIMAKEITKSDQAKNEFISSISHELRTPLTSIKGWGETILDAVDDTETVEEGLNIICHETDRLIVLVNDLLDFSKLQGQRLELHKEEFPVDKLLQDIKSQFVVRAKQEKIKLTLFQDDDHVLIMADYNRLKQVLINVIDNAMKFTAGRPGAEIKLSSEIIDDQLVITVNDNGSGITPEDLQMVKDKFYKGTSKKSGTGLGLSIASEIVELHGGKLYVDSVLNNGTKVVILLPLLYELMDDEEELEY